jgi:heptosyltransferase III
LTRWKKAAVIPCKGIGDALLMMIASYQLHKAGSAVTTFHPALGELQNWFPGQKFAPLPPLEELAAFSLIVVENDNSEKIDQLRALHKKGVFPHLSIFYPTHSPYKHPPLNPQDIAFDATRPMAENIANGIAKLLGSETPSKENGLAPPHHLIHKRHLRRIVIHPTSSLAEKNWDGYARVAAQIKARGFEPVIAVSAKEKGAWQEFNPPHFATLADLAAFVYESGFVIGNDSLIGHLASNLQIPTLIIADDKKRMQLWRPGWLEGGVLTPADWIPRRLRKRAWKRWISARRVSNDFLRSFQGLIDA